MNTRLLTSLLRSERGSVVPLLAFGLLSVMGTVGMAVDGGRSQLVQAKLSSALDAAGLAAGATANTADINAEVQKYLNANFGSSYLDSTITGTTVNVSSDNQIITLSATASVPMTMMRIFGFDDMEVTAEAEITRANKGLELVMVLDNTGSMASHMGTLRQAANDLVSILYGNRTEVDDLYIGLVPFAQGVNIGSSRTGWVNSANLTGWDWGPTASGGGWGGCVDARTSTNRDTTDDPPSVERFVPYYWADHNSHNDWIRNNGTYITPLSATRGPNKFCSAAVTPMTRNRTTITNAIAAMVSNGNTHINEGAVWGWRMLSPRWRGVWGGDMDALSLPLNYNTPLMNKAVVIMTDGDNVISSSSRGAYGYLSDGRLGTTNQSTAETRLDQRLSTVCTNMKNNNILVYTVGFGTISSSTQTLLRNCATQADYFFLASNSTALRNSFRMIGDSLANLRVSK